MCDQGCLLALAGKTADAVPTIIAGVAAWRSVGATLYVPLYLAYLAKAYAELGQMDDASRCIGEAMTTVHTTEERLWEAEVNRIAGEIAAVIGEMPQKRKRISSAHSPSRVSNKPNPGNCAPQ